MTAKTRPRAGAARRPRRHPRPAPRHGRRDRLGGPAHPGSRRCHRPARVDAAFPYRIVTNTSAVSRERLSFWSRRLGARHPARAVHVGACRRRRRTARGTTRASPVRPRLGRREARIRRPAPAHARRGGCAGGHGRRRPDRRLARGGDVRQPQPGVPADPAVARRSSDAPESVVADARRAHARLRLVRRRARVLGRASRRVIAGKPSPTFYSSAVADLRRQVGPLARPARHRDGR